MIDRKLISVRLDKEDIKAIDKWCAVDGVYRRSDVIYAGVRLMAALCKHRRSLPPLRFYPNFGDVLDDFVLEYHREHK